MKRRHLVLAPLAVAGALAVGWALLPVRQRLVGAEPLPPEPGRHAFNGWVRIGEDDRVHLVCPKTEMGQGVHTGLAMLLAEELGVGLERIAIAPAPIDAIYGNLSTVVDSLPFLPDDESVLRRVTEHLVAKIMREAAPMLTGGSSSLKDLWVPLRLAGAAARQMLQAEAAARWGVAPGAVSLADGRLHHAASGRTLRFGELAAAAAARPLPDEPQPRPAAEWRLIGRALPRLDAAALSSGQARYGIDVRQPGLAHAALALPPTLAGRVRSVDDSAARALPGVRAVVRFEPPATGGPGGVAVIADTTWQAMQAAQALQVQWDEGTGPGIADSAALQQACEAALAPDAPDTPFAYLERGDVEAALAGAARRIEATYRAPFLAHQVLEPANATVRVDEGRATVWAPTQAPDLARGAVARALGLPAEAVTVNVTLAGGGFGRRLDVDFIEQAARVAQALPGVPVQVLWSRAQDTQHDFYRPACVARLRAGFDAQGRLVAWDHHAAGPLLTPAVMARFRGGAAVMPTMAQGQGELARALGPLGALNGLGVVRDKLSAEGGFDPVYAWPAARMRHTPVQAAVPVGFWRSVGHSHMGFFTEGFIDECAAAAGADPVAFRRDLLAAQPRHRAVLDRAAAAAGWGTPSPPAPDGAPTARGVALHASFGSVVAMVATVSVARGEAEAARRIRVHRVVAAIDCGVAVNPKLVRQQLEGSVVFALSAALHGGITVAQGRVQQTHFLDQPLVRMGEAPVVEVEIVDSALRHPEGVGEPGVPPLAPAVAAAVAALTGVRLRELPLRLPATPA
ncbi:MAG: xanthine dehydrogenase family protein molybdopterin-binding subunit [Ideonella sp. WA131b]|nr:xanthine dehydrogenase family protein molybdopterin-binding subunit [Ideonella sp. WA131b]